MKDKEKGCAHVIAGGKGFRCLHCGVEDDMGLTFPVRLNLLAEAGRTFEREHKRCKPSEAGKKRFEFETPDDWKNSWDTGISSGTLWSFFTGRHVRECGVPHDPADFGRCHRLLKAFPAWRARLPEFAVSHPEWDGLVSRWSDLENLYEEELPTGKAPKLYCLMQALLGKGVAP